MAKNISLDAFHKYSNFFDELSADKDTGCVNFLNDEFDEELGYAIINKFDKEQIGCQTFVFGSLFITEWDKNPEYNRVCAYLLTEKGLHTCHFIDDDKQNDEDYWDFVTWEDITDLAYDKNVIIFYNKQHEEIAWVGPISGFNENNHLKEWFNVFQNIITCAYGENTLAENQENNSTYIKKYMNIDKNKIEYVIGIDLGHGETSAALCPIQWDKQADQLEDATDLDMGGNKKVLPSAITLLNDGRAYIGDAAFNPDILKQAQVRVCFKQAPKDIDGEAEKIMIRFMAEVYKLIRENNSGLLTDDNHVVYIATPSGWNKEQQELYVKMAEIAGIPIAGVTKESRAAFVKAQKDVTSGIGRNVSKGAIVFDMGSSTLDFTYMNNKLSNMIDQGYNCGASFIEKDIFKKKENEDDSIQAFEQKYPGLVDYLVFEARKVKEQVYFNPKLRVKKTVNFDDIVEDEDLEDERFKIAFQPGQLNEMLKEDGYFQTIEQAMLDFKHKFIDGQNIYGVFMTGGASRMDFLKSLICKCWEVDETQIYRDNDPSLTISQGVAEVARLDFHTNGQDKDLEELINKVQNSDDVYETFIQMFGHDMCDRVTDAMAEAVENWTNSKSDLSVNNLQTRIMFAIERVAGSFSGSAVNYIDTAIAENTKEIHDRVQSIISLYASQGYEVSVPEINVGAINIPNVNLEGIMNGLAEKLKDDSTGWGAAIGGAALGGAIAMLLGGPLTWMVGGAALLGKMLFGSNDSEEEKKRKALKKDLDAGQRQEVYNSLSNDWENITNSVSESIEMSLRGNTDIKKTINRVVKELMSAYKENLKNARILID